MKKFYIKTVLLSMILLISVSGAAYDEAASRSAADSVGKFGIKLFKTLARTSSGNIALSPESISEVCAMVYMGAEGNTKEQMSRRCYFEVYKATVAKNFVNLKEGLRKSIKKSKNILRVANGIWIQNDYSFLPEYLEETERSFDAKVSTADFKMAATERSRINRWVNRETRGKIKDLLKQRSIGKSTRMVLVNALYFKGEWAKAFARKGTSRENFYTGESTVTVRMMHLKASFVYGERDDCQVLELPYKGHEQSMVIILPKKGVNLGEFEQKLSYAKLSAFTQGVWNKDVNVYLPRFKIASGCNLKVLMQRLGIRDAFNDKADLSGITGSKDLYISQARHKTYVKVNEKGTEAAAATQVTMSLMAVNPASVPEFRAERPFLFCVRDNKSGALLIIGRVANPKGR